MRNDDLEVRIAAGSVTLEGNLSLPDGAQGIVLFAHGSGSSRFSPRNRYVAQMMHEGGLGTLLFDLLTAEEEETDVVTRELRFDIDLLAERLVGATDWLLQQPEAEGANLGYFGSSTGSAAALIASTKHSVQAVVSRGGRPDLAEAVLAEVTAPVLLIVGGIDLQVLDLNRQALAQLPVDDKQLEIVAGAGHLFEGPGELDEVGRLARRWFRRHLLPQ